MSSLARASGKDEDAGVGDGDWVGVDEGLMAKTMMRRTPAPRASRAVAARGGRSRGGALEQLNRSGGSTNRRRDVRLRASTFIFELSELFLHAPRSELRTAKHRTRETRAQRQRSPSTVTATCMRPQYLPFTSLPFTLTEL